MNTNTCCFTGLRPQKLPFGFQEDSRGCRDLKEALLREILYLIEEHRVRCFLTGMALGVDQWAAEAVLYAKPHYPGLRLHAILPCRTQADRWNAAQRQRYADILSRCDQCLTLQESYSPACMQARNRYMVNHSRLALAVWDGSPGGTGQTVAYALQKNCQVLLLHPQHVGQAAVFLNRYGD